MSVLGRNLRAPSRFFYCQGRGCGSLSAVLPPTARPRAMIWQVGAGLV